MVLGALTGTGDSAERIDLTVEVITRHVDAYPAHVRFLARERHGGVQPVREAIDAELRRFAEEVAAALAADPGSAGWGEDDLRMLAGFYVDHMVATAVAFLDAAHEGPDAQERVAREARRRMRLISLGRRHWLD
jgi:hypothetical protein